MGGHFKAIIGPNCGSEVPYSSVELVVRYLLNTQEQDEHNRQVGRILTEYEIEEGSIDGLTKSQELYLKTELISLVKE